MSLLNQGFNEFYPITLSDTVNILSGLTDAIYIGAGSGKAVCVMENGQTCEFDGLITGTVYPLRVIRVNNTTTNASSLVALYVR